MELPSFQGLRNQFRALLRPRRGSGVFRVFQDFILRISGVSSRLGYLVRLTTCVFLLLLSDVMFRSGGGGVAPPSIA